MKNTILTLTFTIFGLFAMCQKNEISIGVFSPIMTNSMKQYFTDEWLLTPSVNYSRKYLSLGYSFSYQMKINDFSLGINLGFVTRSVSEKNEYDYNSGAHYYVNETFEYKQTHFLTSITFSKDENFKNLRIRLKSEIPFVYYGKGTNDYYNRTNSDYPTDYIWTENQKISAGFATGLGIGIGVYYKLTDKFNVGLEISEYLLYTSFNKPSNVHSTGKDVLGNTGAGDYDTEYEVTNKYNQIGFSRVVPLFRIGYEF